MAESSAPPNLPEREKLFTRQRWRKYEHRNRQRPEVRARLRDLLDKILSGETDFVIERHGKPIAALIPVRDFEALQGRRWDDLRAARRAGFALEAWRRDPSTGRPFSEVRAGLIEEGLLDG